MTWLEEHCPRLALAVQQERRVLREREERRLLKMDQKHELERLVAHRDLQYQRAANSRRRGWIRERQYKLAKAQRDLDRIRRDLETAGTWEPGWAR